MKLPFMWVDAFTQNIYSGNPCSVVFEADHLSTKEMQQVAKEFNLSETAFVTRVEGNQVTARYFTPVEEIPMAGHPTISTVYALWLSNRISKDISSLKLTLPAGVFDIEVEEDGSVVMQQKAPQFLKIYDREFVASIFSLSKEDLLPGAEIQTVSTGTPQLMIPVLNLEVLKKACLKINEYTDFKKEGDFFSPHLFCLQGFSKEGATFARHFGVPPDTFEDAFTGSASGGMAAYIWNNDLINETSFVAEQGHWMGRPGQARLEIVGSKTDIQGIKIKGSAVQVMDGTIRI